MLSERVCFSSDITTNEREYCQNTSELFKNRSIYILLERFINTIVREKPEYDDFLNRYFNDEGYIDIWRIPLLLLDLVTENCDLHAALLEDKMFRARLMSFIGDFYNYLMKKSNLLLIENNNFTDYKSNVFHIRKNQYMYNMIADSYCKICDKLNSYGVA